MGTKQISDFEKKILNKIDNNEQLTEDEVSELVYSDNVIDSVDVCEWRWTAQLQSIVQLGGRTFRIYWERGLTECQDNLFEPQIPVEVKPVKKMIETTEWVELERENGK